MFPLILHGVARTWVVISSTLRRRRPCHRRMSSVAAVLANRAIIEISGADAKALLQGLITNDVSLLDEDRSLSCISTAFLNPKGRVLADALVTRSPRHEAKQKTGFLLDCPLAVAERLKSHLKTYKLRSKVKIKDVTSMYDVLVSGVHDPWEGSTKSVDGTISSPDAGWKVDLARGQAARFIDPRCAALGVRLLRPKDEGEVSSEGETWRGDDVIISEGRYDALRMFNGVAEGDELLDSIPLESNLDFLGSISFTKGCYVGQELTARTQFKGFVRKRLLPVLFPAMEVTEDAASPVKHASDLLENQQTLGLTGSTWGVEGGPDAAPTRGSTVIDRAGGDEKLGTLVAFSPAYNVGLALLRLGKILPLPAATPDDNLPSNGAPGIDLCVTGSSSGGRLRCVPVTPLWWPINLDPTTGKIAA